MTLLQKNIIANITGNTWQAIIGLLFVPFYLKFMGVEAYGLIGVFATLQVIFGLLDLGLGSSLTREMARLSVLENKKQETRNLVRTMEIIYWCLAVIMGVSVIAISPLLAHHWLKAGHLPDETITQAILVMGIVIMFQMPAGFYSGGLVGLQKQVLLNMINAVMSTIKGVGAILILSLVSSSIIVFFLWQAIITVINTFLFSQLLWRNLPSTDKKAAFQKNLLKGIWRFAAGMSGITLLSVILSQMDKIILSKMLSLEMFGYYSLASMVAMSLGRLFTPVFMSIYPRFTQLVSQNNYEELKQLYHKSCQFMSVLILPAAVVIALFSHDILLLWTRNAITADNSYILLSILICGTAINGLMNQPYALQLAVGWTSLSFYKTLIAVVLLVPLLVYMTNEYGAIGAAIVWLILHVSLFFIEIPIMHIRLLRKEKWRWYLQDVFHPLAACILMAGLGRIFISGPVTQFMMLFYLTIISVLTLGITAIITPVTRAWLFEQWLKIKYAHGN